MMAGRPALEVEDLSFTHPDGTPALHGVSFSLEPGENVVLLGPNGSGKTTLLLNLNGTLQGQGAIRVCGLELSRSNAAEIRRRVGIVFQDADDQLFMPTVLEDVMFGLRNLGYGVEQAGVQAKATLERVGIGSALHDRAPYHLSAGEKRRVAIAGVLVMNPDLLLLDEPTTSLDPPGQKGLLNLLAELPQSKVIATHDIPFARALASRAIFLDRGRITGEDTLDRIVERFDWNPYP